MNFLTPLPPLFAPLPPWPWEDLRPHYYNLLCIDPPWDVELYSEAGETKSARAQYDTMPLEEIQALPVRELADVISLLLCWVIAPRLPDCIETIRTWGFTYRSFLHWRKVFRSGKPAWGTGYRVRSLGELIIVATIGAPKHKPFPGDFAGIRREHSRKPEEFYSLVDKCCPRLRRRALALKASRDWNPALTALRVSTSVRSGKISRSAGWSCFGTSGGSPSETSGAM